MKLFEVHIKSVDTFANRTKTLNFRTSNLFSGLRLHADEIAEICDSENMLVKFDIYNGKEPIHLVRGDN